MQGALSVMKDQTTPLKQLHFSESHFNTLTLLYKWSARPPTANKGYRSENGMYITKNRLSWLNEILDLVKLGLGIFWTKKDSLAPNNKGWQWQMLTVHI